jgi:protein-tyrosine phosphatase
MSRFIDLHVHILPGVDDGPRADAQSLTLIRGLSDLGFGRLIATPHVRPPMWDQNLEHLEALRDNLLRQLGDDAPRIDVAAENFFDDQVWKRFEEKRMIFYPGGRAALVEFGSAIDAVPLGFDQRFFEMSVRGVKPVLAHPERQLRLSADIELLERLVNSGVLLLLSLSSLGRSFGRLVRRRAEAIIRSGLPLMAATDAHSAKEIKIIEKGIKRLRKLVGDEELERMLIERPASILSE